MKDKKIIYGSMLVFVFLLTVGLTYAYFSGGITGNETAKDITVQMGNLSLFYDSGQEIKANNIEPGKIITKEFTVTNTGDFNASFNINMIDMINTIEKDELVYTLTCEAFENYKNSSQTSLGECEGEDSTVLLYSKTPTSQTIKENNRIKTGITNKYTLTITFNETGSAQNYNQGKSFSGKLYIGDYSGPPIYAVTFNANGGTTDVKSKKIEYNKEYGEMPTPVKYNYIFNGWYTQESAGTKVEETDIYSLQEDTTLYAQYTKITYTTLASSYSCANHSNANASILSYTGNCTLNDEGGDNYYISFTTSGTLTIKENLSLDAFAAGGGGGGGGSKNNTYAITFGAGGCGGYTKNYKAINVNKSNTLNISVGAGGTGGAASTKGNSGNSSCFGTYCANGGGGGGIGTAGCSGGSGGGASGNLSNGSTTGGAGGSNGGNGTTTGNGAGMGQGTTTYAFAQSNYPLFAGGGGGGSQTTTSGFFNAQNGGAGGTGGGAAGGGKDNGLNGLSASANTAGGGGGAGAASTTSLGTGGNGGSGIVMIRNAR